MLSDNISIRLPAMMRDIPSPIDLRLMSDALAREQSAILNRPGRAKFSAQFAAEIEAASRDVRRVLEVVSGPRSLTKDCG